MSLSAPTTPADDRYKKMVVAATAFAVMLEAGYLLTSVPPYDGVGYLIGRDFVNTWMGAHSAFAGGLPRGSISTPTTRPWRRGSIRNFPTTTGRIRPICC
jgi:hypothetical protein